MAGWFRLWAGNRIWARLLKRVPKAERVVGIVDGTHITVHQSGCNPRVGADRQEMARIRGGRNTKLMALTDPCGRLLAVKLVAGQDFEGRPVLDLLPVNRSILLVGDKAYDDDKLRAALEALGHRTASPGL